MLHLIGINNCDKVRATKNWLKEKNVDFEFIDLKKEPLSRHEIVELKDKVGLDVLVNKRGTTWRKLGLADQDLSENELVEALEANQSMIKRPVLLKDDAVLVGYDEEAFEHFIEE